MSEEQVVILGAGPPHRGSEPSALRTDKGGAPVLEWLLHAAGVGFHEAVFVGGYGLQSVRARYPALRTLEPADWSSTGSAASLLATPLDVGAAALVIYSDILVRPDFVASLRSESAPLIVGWDSQWQQRFAGRQRKSLFGREKVTVDDRSVTRLGPDVSVDEAAGEFVGIVRLSPAAVEHLLFESTRMRRRLPERAHLSLLIEELRLSGMNVQGVDVAGDWAEINDPADIAQFVLGTKADTLRRIRGLVRHAKVADQFTRSVAEWGRSTPECLEAVRERFGDRSLIVRSSTTHEDLRSDSGAGRFVSVIDVRGPEALADAVERVAASYRTAGIHAGSQQILVQPLIEDVILSGVALSRTLSGRAPWRVIEYSEGEVTDVVTSGRADDTRVLYFHRDLVLDPPSEGAASGDTVRLTGVLRALAEIESLIGDDALDVEFAVDVSEQVHVLQVRSMTGHLGHRDQEFEEALSEARLAWDEQAVAPPHFPGQARPLLGVMPDWNPAEIIGTAPGRLALDLYRRLITDDVWAIQRAQAGYRDVRPAPLLVDVAGRPYVDVRASFASFLPSSLEERLAARLLESSLDRLRANPRLHDKVEFSVVPTCVDPDWARWEQRLPKDGHTREEVRALRSALAPITGHILSLVDENLRTVATLPDVSEAATAGVSDPLARAAILLDVATRFGTLPFAHLARAAFVAASLINGARTSGRISEEATADFFFSVNTVSGAMTQDATQVIAGLLEWTVFVERWGHLRPGTYELTSPRYDSDPDRFLLPLVANADSISRSTASGHETWDKERSNFLRSIDELELPHQWGQHGIDETLRRAIAGRESAKFVFSRNLSDALEAIGQGWESRGVDRDVISDAPLALLLPDPAGRVADSGQVREAAWAWKERRKLAEVMPLAPLLTAREDLDVFVVAADLPNFIGRSRVIAPPLLIEEDSSTTAALPGKIVFLSRADPGFDWIFGHTIVGLVTQYGGANSHMAIRCAEHGIPGAIGVGEQRFKDLLRGREIELDPAGRTLRLIE